MSKKNKAYYPDRKIQTIWLSKVQKEFDMPFDVRGALRRYQSQNIKDLTSVFFLHLKSHSCLIVFLNLKTTRLLIRQINGGKSLQWNLPRIEWWPHELVWSDPNNWRGDDNKSKLLLLCLKIITLLHPGSVPQNVSVQDGKYEIDE